jgi:hypothetical protein
VAAALGNKPHGQQDSQIQSCKIGLQRIQGGPLQQSARGSCHAYYAGTMTRESDRSRWELSKRSQQISDRFMPPLAPWSQLVVVARCRPSARPTARTAVNEKQTSSAPAAGEEGNAVSSPAAGPGLVAAGRARP